MACCNLHLRHILPNHAGFALLQLLLLFIGQVDNERPSDALLRFFGKLGGLRYGLALSSRQGGSVLFDYT